MMEHDDEPIRGLPGLLPPGERLLWQGAPDWKRMALDAFHVRGVAIYFALLIGWAIVSGAGSAGIIATGLAAVAGLGLLTVLAYASARTTVYSITSRRVVLRVGIALNKCVNIPLGQVETARLSVNPDGSGNIALVLKADSKIAYALIWPHARPWRFAHPEPLLRALGDVRPVAALLADTLLSVQPQGRREALAKPKSAPRPLAGVRELAA